MNPDKSFTDFILFTQTEISEEELEEVNVEIDNSDLNFNYITGIPLALHGQEIHYSFDFSPLESESTSQAAYRYALIVH